MTWDGAFWLVMVVLITMNLGLKWWTRRRDAQDEADRRFYRCRRRTFLRAREERYEELLRRGKLLTAIGFQGTGTRSAMILWTVSASNAAV